MQNDYRETETPNDDGKTPVALTIAEACAVRGVRRTTIYKEIRSGELRAVKIGGRTVILVTDLHRWLQDRPPIIPEPSQSGP